MAARAIHPAPPASAGWLLGVDGSRQARMKPTDCSVMVSARTSPTPARVARDPCNCAPIHTHIRPACQPSEHPTCARNYRLLCTLLTLFTYALAGDTRQHCHRLQPLRERAKHAGRPCGCWVNSSPSSAPSADAPVGPMLEIQQLIICAVVVSSCSAHTHRSAMDRRVRVRAPTPSSTTTSATTSALATGCRASAGISVPRCAWRVHCAPGSRPRQHGKGSRRAPMAASLGETAAGAAPGSGLMEAGPLAARIGRAGPRGALDRSRPL